MPRLKLLVTVACFSLLTASPALAQHMIDDAGTFPFSMGNPFESSSAPPANRMQIIQADPPTKSHAVMRRRSRQLK